MGQRGLEDHGALAQRSAFADLVFLAHFEILRPFPQPRKKNTFGNSPNATTIPCYFDRLIPFNDNPIRQHCNYKLPLFLPRQQSSHNLCDIFFCPSALLSTCVGLLLVTTSSEDRRHCPCGW